MASVGFIGLGRMGGHMARNLVHAGHTVRVYDLRPQAVEVLAELGAIAVSSTTAVAEGAEFVFTSLPGPAEVSHVWEGEGGLLNAMREGAVGIDLSTVDPDTVRRIEAAARDHGRQFLDSPVSGGVGGADAGTLSIMAGGTAEAFEQAVPLLQAIGHPDRIFHCGEIGSGTVTKLVNNMIGMTTNVVLSEAMAMGVKAGVDAQTLFDVVSTSSGGSATLAQWNTSVLKRDFSPGFMLALGHKDLKLANELSESIGNPTRVTDQALERLAQALDEGWGEQAVAIVVKLQEREAGVEVSPGQTAT